MIVNPFVRVRINPTLGGGTTFGDWGPTVNISAAVSNSLGAPLDWWARDSAAGVISNAIRKLDSPNLFTVTVLNPTDGQPADPGHLDTTYTGGQVTYTDGPSGAGSTYGKHMLDGPDGLGGGFRITVPDVSQWPDWWLLKVWSSDYPARRIRYKASLDNTLASTDELWLDATLTGPDPNFYNDDYTDWLTRRLITHEVKFAADDVSQTLTYDITKVYNYYQSIHAVALYKAAVNRQPARGAIRAITATQRGRPAGA